MPYANLVLKYEDLMTEYNQLREYRSDETHAEQNEILAHMKRIKKMLLQRGYDIGIDRDGNLRLRPYVKHI